MIVPVRVATRIWKGTASSHAECGAERARLQPLKPCLVRVRQNLGLLEQSMT